jgi:hypothetical protein
LVGAKLQKPVVAGALLGVAMIVSATWLLRAGSDLAINGDEVFYIAQLVTRDGVVAPLHGAEYFFAPHNGHLVLGGRLVFQALFDLAGTHYLVFRIAEVAGILVSVGLFYALARRRTEPLIALAFSISLLFLGYANETFLWPFDLHTVYALALGLGALLALERGDRRGDVAACVLLTLSVLTLEVGLAFAVGVAVSVLLRDDRARRLWIFLVPIALYAAWWLWARKFGQSEAELANVHLIPKTLIDALASIAGSLTGLNPTGAAAPAMQTTVTAVGVVLALIALAALALRLRRGAVPPTLWVSLAIALAYWVQIAMGGREVDTARYLFVGTTMVLLVAADALRGVRVHPLAVTAIFVVVALALPANIDKLYDGRAPMRAEAAVTQTEYAMLDLARGRVDSEFVPAADPAVLEAGGGIFVPLSAGNYLDVRQRYGSLGIPLDEVRSEDLRLRWVADATLAGALEIGLEHAAAPADPASCPSVLDAHRGNAAFFDLERGGVLLGSRAGRPVEVGVSRFARALAQVPLGKLAPGDWATVKIPPDAARDPWLAVVDGPVYVCALP